MFYETVKILCRWTKVKNGATIPILLQPRFKFSEITKLHACYWGEVEIVDFTRLASVGRGYRNVVMERNIGVVDGLTIFL